MLALEIYQQILQQLDNLNAITTEQRLQLKVPESLAHVIDVFAQAHVDAKLLLKIIAQLSRNKIYQNTQSHHIDYHDTKCFITNNCLCIVNPYDEQLLIEMLQRKQNKSCFFSEIYICAYNDQRLAKNDLISSETLIVDNDSQRLWLKIILIAKKLIASDVHFLIEDKRVVIAYRVQSQLRYGLVEDLDYDRYYKLINTILAKAGANHASFVNLNKGEFSEQGLGFRLQTMPTTFRFSKGNICPNATLRIHHHSNKIMELDALGLDEAHLEQLRQVSYSATGITLITGPTGSGKTTLLYAMLREIQTLRPDASIRTIEDPVEINLPGITQTQVNAQTGVSFDKAIEAFLRSDPEVALIGEIRNKETAQRSIELALTGHAAYATLHTKNALSSVTRMIDSFAIDRIVLSETLNTVIGIRMLQQVCAHCAELKPLKEHIWHNRISNHKYTELGIDDAVIRHVHDKGCDNCYHGYSDVVPAFELFTFDQAASALIAKGESVNALAHYFNQNQHTSSLWQSGINLLLSGTTTIEQLEIKLPPHSLSHHIQLDLALQHGLCQMT